MAKIYRSLTILFALWLLVWLRLSWPAMQDDAFIHLRYAVNLLRYHMISYNGVHSDYGTSSLLYVWLLAGLRAFFMSPVMPRAVSSVCHVVLFAGLVWGFARRLRLAPRPAWGFALLLLAVLVMPMAVRWLEDGMETSLGLCLASLIAFSISRLGHTEDVSDGSMVWLFMLGFIATLTRVEYLLMMGVASVTLFSMRLSLLSGAAVRRGVPPRILLAARCAVPLFGSLLAAALIFLTMHALVPDTAIAKSHDHASWVGTLHSVASVLVSAISLGVILLLLWVLTAVAVIAYKGRVTLATLAANSLFPVVVMLAALRGQEVQGIRYFVWTLVFPIVWNTLELRWAPREPARAVGRALGVATYAVAGLLLILVPVESTLLYREFRVREQALAEFRAQHLERLSSLRLVAYDIGYIGYFTESPLCDMGGLVNGRVRAALTYPERVKLCVAEHPQYAFVSNANLGFLNYLLNMKGWSVCSGYDLANLRASDMHYLVASPEATAEVCAAAGNTPQSLEPLLHPAPAP